MKKSLTILTISLIAILLIASHVLADRVYVSSGQQTATATIKSGAGILGQIAVVTDGTNAVTIDVYDNASAASGTKLMPTWVITTSATDRCQSWDAPGDGVRFMNGLYVVITCAGTVKYIVYWD